MLNQQERIKRFKIFKVHLTSTDFLSHFPGFEYWKYSLKPQYDAVYDAVVDCKNCGDKGSVYTYDNDGKLKVKSCNRCNVYEELVYVNSSNMEVCLKYE